MTETPFFEAVSTDPALSEREARVLAFWQDQDIFHESLRRRRDGEEWVFYEGPPTANGSPGLHHVWARVFKDIFPRYQTMRGRFVFRKAGWDCHGLPVELEVEKELGITQKAQIEEFGIAEFNQRCRESVQRYVDEWNLLTERIGFWVDLDDAYWTMSPEYVESVWWNLKQMWDQGLLYESHRVVPYCPRCETALSDHEVAQGYAETTDPSVFVRFPVEDRPFDLLVWTTTPWTLFSNTGVAVNPDVQYAIVDLGEGKPVVMAAETVAAVAGDDAAVTGSRSGSDLVGIRYRRPFEQLDLESEPRVVGDDFVTTTEGTGLVHMAPAFGEIDMEIGAREGLAFVNPVGPDGRFTTGPWKGQFVKTADPGIIEDLDSRGLLHRSTDYVHTYPFCWRCNTPLLYWAKASWFIGTRSRKDDLLASNETVNWFPPNVKHGRFGDWLENNVDWALSRDRYWGTPLPVWRCAEGHDTCVGSFAELAELSGSDLEGFDPHRPFVDAIEITCLDCERPARRVPPVIDTWFDSGSMPNGQWHWPFENDEIYQVRYPADFIAEAVDQTRGWFYSLIAISTLINRQSSYRNVLSLGHIVDRDGRKMSKSVGNVINPFDILAEQGADALRWYFFASGTAWSSRRVYMEGIEESARRTLFTLWHTLSFFVTYASLDGWAPDAPAPPVPERPPIDRWILSRLDTVIEGVTEALDGFDAYRGARRIADFVEDLSNWYVRRTRPRFWRGVRGGTAGADPDKAAAYATLHTCLLSTAGLMAPYTPFLAESLYQSLSGANFAGQTSVHFEDWQEPAGDRDLELESQMETVRRVVSLGRTARTQAKIRTRQPLSRLVATADLDLGPELLEEILDELNVKSVESGDVDVAQTATVKPNFARLGPRLGSKVRQVRAALEATDGRAIADALQADGHYSIEIGGEPVDLTPDDVDIVISSAEGWSVAEDGGVGVALDLHLTDDLRDEGWIRELTHALQNARKQAGLAVEDRIRLHLVVPEDRARVVETYGEALQRDLLAVDIGLRPSVDGMLLEVGDVEVRALIEKIG